jgi:hypothetical protein
LKRRRIQNEENCLVVRLSFVLLSWWELFLFVDFFLLCFALLIKKQVRSLQGKKTKSDCFSHQFTWLPELILTRPAWAGFRYCGTRLLLQFWVKFRDW